MEQKLEVVLIPVSDVDRAKEFYGRLGWRLDADFGEKGGRVVQFTPPGSPCSIHFGSGLSNSAPGSAKGTFLIVDDLRAARADLLARGVAVSEEFHFSGWNRVGPGARVGGPAPERMSYGSFASFEDPDGNEWLLQEITTRLPGRGFTLDVANLTALLKETEDHHGEYEPKAPKHHWSGWYAAYIVARERGKTPEEAVQDATASVEGARS